MDTPVEYLTVFLQRQSKALKNFKLVQHPARTLIGAKESAWARYELTSAEGEPLKAESYVFFRGKYAYVLIYRASKESFEKYHDSAMKIIESFQFGSDQET